MESLVNIELTEIHRIVRRPTENLAENIQSNYQVLLSNYM